MSIAEPELLDRIGVYRTGNRAERLALHAQTAALKAEAMAARRRLAERFTGPGPIDRDAGYGALTLEGFEAVREEAYGLIAARDGSAHRGKGSVDYLLNGTDFAPDGAAMRLAQSDEVLGPVCRYLGAFPILLQIDATRAGAADFLPGTTHMFHVDPADVTQVKVFVHLSQVDEDCGPFTALRADLSEQVMAALDYRGGRVTDETIEEIAGPGGTWSSIGPPGTAALCDTTRCFHYGGRPAGAGKPKRDLLILHYVLPTSFVLPRFEGDGKRPRLMPQLRPTGEESWDALIGARHV